MARLPDIEPVTRAWLACVDGPGEMRALGLGSRVPPARAVSAHARDVDRTRAIEAGFDLYVAKPIPPERLIEAVEDLRDIARTHQA